MEIIQNTPAWLETKKTKIGGSEIYSLIYHYCKQELQALGVDLMKEKPFKSALELYIKVKHGEEINDISEVNSEFGKGMEGYINYRLHCEKSNWDCERTNDFIINDKINGLTACSPDGFVTINDDRISDFDKTCYIDKTWHEGVIELKTTPYDFNFEAEKGAKWSYIFQLQYQMMVCEAGWGVLAVISPKEKEFDTDFFKGKIIGKDHDDEKFMFCDQFYNFYHYILPKIPTLQSLIIEALNAFQADLDADKYPTISEGDKVKLEREKKLFGKIWPDKFGELKADEEISAMITERMVAHQEVLKAETVKAELDNKIILATRKYTKITGQDYKIIYDTRGSLRYSKL